MPLEQFQERSSVCGMAVNKRLYYQSKHTGCDSQHYKIQHISKSNLYFERLNTYIRWIFRTSCLWLILEAHVHIRIFSWSFNYKATQRVVCTVNSGQDVNIPAHVREVDYTYCPEPWNVCNIDNLNMSSPLCSFRFYKHQDLKDKLWNHFLLYEVYRRQKRCHFTLT